MKEKRRQAHISQQLSRKKEEWHMPERRAAVFGNNAGIMISFTILQPALLMLLILIGGQIRAAICALYVLIPLFLYPWAFVSHYLRAFWLVLLLVVLLWLHDWWGIGIVALVFLLTSLFLSRQMTKETLSVISPSPYWLSILQGGNTLLVNHHWRYRSERYALDLVGLNAGGRRARGVFPKELTAYHCFGTPLLSPLTGIVIHSENDQPDLEVGRMDKEHALGNYIVIQSTTHPHIQVVLAHLMQHSVTVQPDDIVQPGEVIGRIGNSGNTTEPHLHMHAQTMENRKLKGVPLRIEGRQVMRNSVIPPSPSLKLYTQGTFPRSRQTQAE